jgi:hypothetical protein
MTRRTFLASAGSSMLFKASAAATGVGVLTVAAPRVWDYARNVTIEPPADVCAQKPSCILFLMLDSSEQITENQRHGLSDMVDKLLEKPEPGQRTIVARFTANAGDPIQVLERLCDPGLTKNILIDTPKDVDARRNRDYVDKVRQAVARAYDPPQQRITPFVEAFGSLFRMPEFYGADAAVSKKVVVISDTLQNTDQVTSYPPRRRRNRYGKMISGLPYNVLDQRARPYISSLQATVQNTEITVGFIRRPDQRGKAQPQTARHKAWVKDYVGTSGAVVKWVELW